MHEAAAKEVTLRLDGDELMWKNVTLSVQEPDMSGRKSFLGLPSCNKKESSKRKLVLNGVSGAIEPGETLALMGPSGSGKTSLLCVLAGRLPPKGRLEEGSLLTLGGVQLTKPFYRRCGFVFQDDLLLAALTVKETIEFAAKLRLPQSLGDEERTRRVEQTLTQLQLNDCADTAIGSEKQRGVSGGERKRCAVGVELVSRPPILFLDEPTSGLDAASALSLALSLRKYAKDNEMIVLSSVHQPRSNIFSLFDRLLLLSKGSTVYYGSVAGAVPYIEEHAKLRLPPQTNPADWLIDLIDARSSELLDAWRGFSEQSAKGSGIADGSAPFSGSHGSNGASEHRVTKATGTRTAGAGARGPASANTGPTTSSWFQFRVLLARSAKQQRGDVYNKTNCFQILAVAVIAALLWSGDSNISDRKGVLFFVNIQQAFNAQNTVLRLFPRERSLMLRERRCGSYRMLPYFLAKSASDSVSIFVLPVIYAIIIYFSVGLRREAGAFFVYLALSLSTVFAGQSIGLIISLAVPDFALANCISFVAVLLIMLFGGFYVGVERIPEWLAWFRYLSFVFWGYSGMIINEFGNNEIPCDQASPGEYGEACPIDGDLVVKSMGYGDLSVGLCVGMLLLISFSMRFLGYVALRFNINFRV